MNEIIVTGLVESIEPPVQANPAAGVNGRASFKLMVNGQKMFANAQTGPSIQQGQTYALTTSLDKYNNTWINSVTPSNGSAPTPAANTPQAPQAGNRDKDRSIILQSILKACNGDIQKADMALDWYMAHQLGLWDTKLKRLMNPDPVAPAEPGYPPPNDDEIPY